MSASHVQSISRRITATNIATLAGSAAMLPLSIYWVSDVYCWVKFNSPRGTDLAVQICFFYLCIITMAFMALFGLIRTVLVVIRTLKVETQHVGLIDLTHRKSGRLTKATSNLLWSFTFAVTGFAWISYQDPSMLTEALSFQDGRCPNRDRFILFTLVAFFPVVIYANYALVTVQQLIKKVDSPYGN